MEFLKQNFDKLLLTLIFIIIFGTVIYMVRHAVDGGVINWAREQAATVLGGLLGLITGFHIGKAVADDRKDNNEKL